MNLPGLHEMRTGFSWATKSACGYAYKLTGDVYTSNQFFDGASNDVSNYFDTSLVGGAGKIAVQTLRGDHEGAKKTFSNVVNTMDGIPIVGHVKGVAHLTTGDEEHFQKCMKDATRTTAVIGTAALTGGGSLVVAGAASTVCGVTYDVTMSGVTNEKYGIAKSFEDAKSDSSRAVDLVMALGADCATGAATAKVKQHIDKGKQPQRNKSGQGSQSTSAASTGQIVGGCVIGAFTGFESAIVCETISRLLLQIREYIKIGGWKGVRDAIDGIKTLFMRVYDVAQAMRARVTTIINALRRCTELIKAVSEGIVSMTKMFVLNTLAECTAVLNDVAVNCSKFDNSIKEFQTSITSLMEMVQGIKGS